MSSLKRLAPALLAGTIGIGTSYYTFAPEFADGGLGAEVIPPEQRKNTPKPWHGIAPPQPPSPASLPQVGRTKPADLESSSLNEFDQPSDGSGEIKQAKSEGKG